MISIYSQTFTLPLSLILHLRAPAAQFWRADPRFGHQHPRVDKPANQSSETLVFSIGMHMRSSLLSFFTLPPSMTLHHLVGYPEHEQLRQTEDADERTVMWTDGQLHTARKSGLQLKRGWNSHTSFSTLLLYTTLHLLLDFPEQQHQQQQHPHHQHQYFRQRLQCN
jgi:hypothetical protein